MQKEHKALLGDIQ